ncbi:hypothetical protein [Vibrio vulnificus]|uniref:hypothetical protein n=1 Tax=Vibrio vulnificus TaxID=672 RepID=UPI00188D9724|nr:hypothetical protein [Vibrio vulnificus]MBF4450168.1 hypothetical protein [Vibrio vulnificus]MBF4496752.1 hypothetical protein [Vibrio vulnificus]MBL6178202.1 hypothetical protein [Vibrio vulnificus]HDY7980325.1 hypothetical protein [Vibrio vulnificus]HDY8003786.1 hypothetical protein [Vibrio vulnificus]
MDRVDFTLEQKQQMLVGIDSFFKRYGSYPIDDQTYSLIAMCLWDSKGFQVPPLYDDADITLNNDFESKYRLVKAVTILRSSGKKPLGYGILLNFYFNLFQTVISRLQLLHEELPVAIKHVISPLFVEDKVLRDYIYQDFDGLGNGLTKVGKIYIHPLWSTYMFREEVVFEDELLHYPKA